MLVNAFENHLNNQVAALLTQLNAVDAELFIGLSGGADSVALLFALAQTPYRQRLTAIHINHQLQAAAGEWAGFCESLCTRLKVRYKQQSISLEAETIQRLGLEAAAREARYLAFKQHMPEAAVLLTAHHADDQLETLLLRLERGVDFLGLQGMQAAVAAAESAWSVAQIRPLLESPKSALLEYLQQAELTWIEDPSNQQTQFRRNYYRQQLCPQLPASLQQKLLQTAGLAQQCVQLLDARIEEHVDNTAFAFAWPRQYDVDNDWARFQLKRFLQQQGIGLPKARLNELIRQLVQARGSGRAPFYSGPGYALYLRGRLLTVKVQL